MKTIKLNNFVIGADKLTVLCGPCAIETEKLVFQVAEFVKQLSEKYDINFVFKASFDKANRSSIKSFRGFGMEKGLKILADVKKTYDLPIVTDIHETYQAEPVAEVADILQIPAFLCRQTDLLVAAAKTGKIINIKKGQFLAPNQMKSIANKVIESGNEKILLTDRGSSFGYNNLVSDMRAIAIMQNIGFPVIFDATHSVQLPGGAGESSSGERQFVPLLAKSAIAAGANGLFFEIHPNPDEALCDGPNMLNFETFEKVLNVCNQIFELLQRQE